MNSKSVMTLTYGDRAEAHVGMEIHGVGAVEGYSVDEVHDFHHHLNHEYDINFHNHLKHDIDLRTYIGTVPYCMKCNGISQTFVKISAYFYCFFMRCSI